MNTKPAKIPLWLCVAGLVLIAALASGLWLAMFFVPIGAMIRDAVRRVR